MIYTITFNPAIDYIVSVADYRGGAVNRSSSEKLLAGGKGINVSTVLMNLGHENTALGFLAGFTGDEIKRILDEMGVKTDFIELKDGYTRINVKLKCAEETEINGQGPAITNDALNELMNKLDALQDGDFLVLAGSIPSTLPDTVYCDIMARLSDKKLNIVVDATGELLVNVLKYHPFLIKPNNHELGEIFGKVLKSDEEIIECAKALQEKGARNILVSMAGDGGIFIGENGEIIKSLPPQGKVVNSTGAGDSMVAGFIAGYLETGDYRTAFLMGLSAGSASAFSENLATGEEVRTIYNTIK
jgi:1-phosphofructokinase